MELMGHKVGWLTLYAGIAGGADIILIPEIPYDINSVVKSLEERQKKGNNFSIIAVAEGVLSREDARLSKKELKDKMKKNQYPSIAYKVGCEIENMINQDVRITVPGHMQRGGSPCPYDRVLATRLGSYAAQMIIEKNLAAWPVFVMTLLFRCHWKKR